jgi:gamma-glutamyltranspeptidase/glutathione hydrolase
LAALEAEQLSIRCSRILNVIECDIPIEKAIEAMKIHHQWSPDMQKALEQMGRVLNVRGNLGCLMAILRPPDMNVYIGAADSSSPDGGAVGY